MEKATFVQKVVIKHPFENKFLLLIRNPDDKSRPGDFDIPGGSLKDGELHEEALLREVKEETSLDIYGMDPVIINTSYDKSENKYFIYIGYKATAKDSNVVIDPKEHSDFIWMTLQDFQNKAPEHILMTQIVKSFK